MQDVQNKLNDIHNVITSIFNGHPQMVKQAVGYDGEKAIHELYRKSINLVHEIEFLKEILKQNKLI